MKLIKFFSCVISVVLFASFASANFTVSSGAVTITGIDGGTF